MSVPHPVGVAIERAAARRERVRSLLDAAGSAGDLGPDLREELARAAQDLRGGALRSWLQRPSSPDVQAQVLLVDIACSARLVAEAARRGIHVVGDGARRASEAELSELQETGRDMTVLVRAAERLLHYARSDFGLSRSSGPATAAPAPGSARHAHAVVAPAPLGERAGPRLPVGRTTTRWGPQRPSSPAAG